MDNENIYDAAYSENNTNSEEILKNSSYNENNNKKKKKGSGFGKYVSVAVICSLLGGIIGSGITYSISGGTLNKNSGTNNPIIMDPVSFASDDNTALSRSDVYKKVAPAVVIVSTKSIKSYNGWFSQEVEGIGSGFIINEDGYILTNYHVIGGAKEVTVTLSDGQEVTATVVNYDANQDVAMIKLNGDVKVPGVVTLGNSDALQPGEEVLAIGTPLSKELSYTLTNGIVSALNRNVEAENGVALNLIQTNADINPGNSGGPLINTKGEVVGINTLKIGDGAEGIGFAIPINDIKTKVDSLSKPILTLGITIRTVDEEDAKQYKLEEGLYILEVTPYSLAEKAGLKPQDVIVKVDGTRVKTSEELQNIKNSKEEGDTMKVQVVRDGKTVDFNIVLTAE